jgi:hypothetical protein
VRFQRHRASLATLGRVGAVLTVFWAVIAMAGPFSQLQVLLPGETAAPGSPDGKAGSPDAQVMGVPFTVLVRACDADWNTVDSANDVVRLTSTAGSAVLPAPSVLIGGQASLVVVLPSVGTSQFTAHDQSDPLSPVGLQDLASPERQAGSAFVASVTAIDGNGNVTAETNSDAEAGTLTNYPNPFNPGDGATTTIEWHVDKRSAVRLRIYSTSGGLVLDRRFTDVDTDVWHGADFAFDWDGTNDDGEPVASGGYVLRFEAQGSGSIEHVLRRKIGVVW